MALSGTSRGGVVDDFDGYDLTPYSGGYDISLTYGRPLPPTEETCYPLSSSAQVDYVRPNYSSGAEISAFDAEYGCKGDSYGPLRPGFKQPPPPVSNTSYPNYGHVGSCTSGGEYASEIGSSYGGQFQPQEYGSGYGSRKPQEYGSEYGSGRKPQYGSGYGKQEESYGYGGSGYGKNKQEGYGSLGYGGSVYRRSDVESYGGGGGGYGKNDDYEGKVSFGGSDKFDYDKEGSGRYWKSTYGDDEKSSGYTKPIYYGGEAGVGHGRPNYGNESEEEKKHLHQKHHHHHHYNY